MRKINQIIIHHSASSWGSVKSIREWHEVRGFDDIGYHFVIENGHNGPWSGQMPARDGTVGYGRKSWVPGAHAEGNNKNSLGICLIGNGLFTASQIHTLKQLIVKESARFNIPFDQVIGHYEIDPKKPLCPGIDMVEFRKELAKEAYQKRCDQCDDYLRMFGAGSYCSAQRHPAALNSRRINYDGYTAEPQYSPAWCPLRK